MATDDGQEAAKNLMDHSPGFLALVNEAKKRVTEISVTDVRSRMSGGKARLIDVREDREWDEAHARGALHMSKGTIERDIEKTVPDRDAELILYCGGGFRSALATDALQKMGYRNVRSMSGGWRAWQEAGAETESSRFPQSG